MARMTFKAGEEYALKLSKLGNASEETAKTAVYKAAYIMANKIRSNLAALPVENYRRLKDGEKFSGLSNMQKEDLLSGFGVASIKTDSDGIINTKIGFDGYGRKPTKKYPNGLPNQLLARSVESGSSIRKKTPFVRPAVNATNKMALAEMEDTINKKIEEIMK